MIPSYFLISVSNKTNLDLCIKYALAGFTNSINGVWTFFEIKEGDYISFLYGAKVHNLYRVKRKFAIKNADRIGPWPKVTFSMSGKTYYFPFRIELEPIRKFCEPMVRQEFSYVAENLLLRGGYRKTHFQADQTTLQLVSQMGVTYKNKIETLKYNCRYFNVLFTFEQSIVNPPQVFYFKELILQSLIRHYIAKPENLKRIFNEIGLNNLSPFDFEVLGEKALPEGHIDILIKEKCPQGYCKKIIIEVKRGKIQKKDILQIDGYIKELGKECVKGILIGKSISDGILKNVKNIEIYKYSFLNLNKNKKYTFQELLSILSLSKV